MALTELSDTTAPTEDAPEGPGRGGPVSAAALAAVVVGMAASAIYRQGAFYPADAVGLAVAGGVVSLLAFGRNRDRTGVPVMVSVGGLTIWWLVRAGHQGNLIGFLPFGASLLGFLAAFLVMRCQEQRDRTRVAMAVAALGALSAAAGLAAVLGRWRPLAQPAGGGWRLATTLTYPAGAAVLFIVALLVALALDARAPLVRLAVCLSLAGLLATQSRWDLVALAAGGLVVPARAWRAAVWPLAMGAVTGLMVVASATGHRPGWAMGVLAVVAVAASAAGAPGRRSEAEVVDATRRAGAERRRWTGPATVVALGAVAVLIVVVTVHPPGGGARQATDQGQTVAWSAAGHTWRSSVTIGVGPATVYAGHEAVATYPGFGPDGELTVLADGGVVGAVLLVAAVGAVAAAIVRRDLLSSCAAAGAVAFVVAGTVDFDWQLPAVAVLGGCVAGLAAAPAVAAAAVDRPDPAISGRRWRGSVVAASVVGVVVAVMAAQLVVGADHQAGGVTRATSSEPPPSPTPGAPARTILEGPDPTDPFMVRIDGRYFLYTSEGTSYLNVPVRTGTRIGRWSQPVDALPRLPAWAAGGLTWAPDVQKVSGGWALYFTALMAGFTPATHCIGAAYARSPTGPFTPVDRPFICQRDHRGSIDPRVFTESNGRLVMLWKSDDNANPSLPGPDQNGKTGIYAQDLSADGRALQGRAVEILSPSQAWEGTIIEAPDMVEAWGTYWLFFSGNWYDSSDYGIGVAACQSPFGPCQDPDPDPFLGSNQQGSGPGEASLFKDNSGVYLLYNPFKANDPGPVIPRPVVMAHLGFTVDGPYLAAQ
jgi:hypothetical protein